VKTLVVFWLPKSQLWKQISLVLFRFCSTYTVRLKKNAPLLFPQISHQRKKIFTPNCHYFVGNLVGNKMAYSNLPGKISLKLEMKSSRNGAFFNQKNLVSNG
jgi:hypothetical protein